jgi:hypothetical protein
VSARRSPLGNHYRLVLACRDGPDTGTTKPGWHVAQPGFLLRAVHPYSAGGCAFGPRRLALSPRLSQAAGVSLPKTRFERIDRVARLAHPIHERLRLNQTERVDIATSTFPGTSVMWHMRFWKAAEDGLFMTTVNKTG